MNFPLISIIVPLFNVEKYVLQSIESILKQTYKNFELILINDGSTDKTLEIVQKINDARINIINNRKNYGLAYSLNRGVQKAKGVFIGRMDGDDLCELNRFEKQVAYLQQHPEVTMVDSIMKYFDENNNDLKKINSNKISFESIKKELPKSNCLGHSSILIKTDVLKAYKYNNVGNEDYELWLRLVSDHKIINKLNEPLLWYRIHSTSYTSLAHKNGTQFYRSAYSKWYFLKREYFEKKRITKFNTNVLFFMIKDFVIGTYKWIKMLFKK